MLIFISLLISFCAIARDYEGLVASNAASVERLRYPIQAELKANVALACVAVFNPALEIGFTKHSALQIEYFGTYAEKNYLGLGFPFYATIGYLDYRYYFKGDMKGWFVGPSFGTGVWKMSRAILSLDFATAANGGYDVGASVFLGVALGYKFLFNDRWGLEISVTDGMVHGNHESYNKHSVLTVKSNGTDEYLPYKGGIYFSYRF